MCIVSTEKNIYSRGIYREFFLSLSNQNYTNFHIVVIDDASNDDSVAGMYAYVSKHTPRLKSRVTFVQNKNGIGAFANKDSGIK